MLIIQLWQQTEPWRVASLSYEDAKVIERKLYDLLQEADPVMFHMSWLTHDALLRYVFRRPEILPHDSNQSEARRRFPRSFLGCPVVPLLDAIREYTHITEEHLPNVDGLMLVEMRYPNFRSSTPFIHHLDPLSQRKD